MANLLETDADANCAPRQYQSEKVVIGTWRTNRATVHNELVPIDVQCDRD